MNLVEAWNPSTRLRVLGHPTRIDQENLKKTNIEKSVLQGRQNN
jgi:hypothetical protein